MHMQIYWSIDDLGLALTLQQAPPAVVTLGTFDGVHRGHQSLLRRVVELAQFEHATPVALVFAPHPQQVLRGTAPVALTSLAQRLELIGQCGIRHTAVVEFDSDLATMQADDFADLLCKSLRPKALVLGYDFRFGKDGAGTLQTFRHLARHCPPVLEQIAGTVEADAPVSSSRIRQALAEHKLHVAQSMLGRHYCVRGIVVHGLQRGRTLGFPTANVQASCDVGLPTGIYAGWTTLRTSGDRYASAISLGYNPTFDLRPAEPVLEVHLLDFDQNIYGQELDVEFVEYLRGEMRFNSPADLTQQIAADVSNSRLVLSRT